MRRRMAVYKAAIRLTAVVAVAAVVAGCGAVQGTGRPEYGGLGTHRAASMGDAAATPADTSVSAMRAMEIADAREQYSGSAAAVSGFGAGALCPFVGWLAGSAVVRRMTVEVSDSPRLKGLTGSEREEYEEGYTETVRGTRTNKFDTGAGFGSFVVIGLYLAFLQSFRVMN